MLVYTVPRSGRILRLLSGEGDDSLEGGAAAPQLGAGALVAQPASLRSESRCVTSLRSSGWVNVSKGPGGG